MTRDIVRMICGALRGEGGIKKIRILYSSFKERPADPRKSNQTLRRWPAANTATRQ
jgi:hypothetical protein